MRLDFNLPPMKHRPRPWLMMVCAFAMTFTTARAAEVDAWNTIRQHLLDAQEALRSYHASMKIVGKQGYLDYVYVAPDRHRLVISAGSTQIVGVVIGLKAEVFEEVNGRRRILGLNVPEDLSGIKPAVPENATPGEDVIDSKGNYGTYLYRVVANSIAPADYVTCRYDKITYRVVGCQGSTFTATFDAFDAPSNVVDFPADDPSEDVPPAEQNSAIEPAERYKIFVNQSGSMEPTIRSLKDGILVDLSAYRNSRPQRGDIVVFRAPIDTVGSQTWVKRIVGLPGDRVSVRSGTFYINGTAWPLPQGASKPQYSFELRDRQFIVNGIALDPNLADIPPASSWSTGDRLPPGCYFVIGDNAVASEDSHIFGCAEFEGTFSAGVEKGQSAKLTGKVMKIMPIPTH